MTQEVTQTGTPRPEESSIADGPVGVVDHREQESGAESDEAVQSLNVDAGTTVLPVEADAGADGAEVEDVAVEAATEPSEADIIAQLREDLAAAQAEVSENVDRLQRSAAEFQNARRRQERQLSDAIDRANADLIRRLLPILDDLDLAFQNAPQSAPGDGETGEAQLDEGTAEEVETDAAGEAWVEGFRQIQKKLLNILEDEGVTPIDASGEFDPELHEAVLSEESEDVESGHVIGVLRTGYEFKGKVLRPAMVRVAA